MSGPTLISHGCRLNIAESEKIAAMLAGESDLVVVNSCAVTAEAVKTARQAIRRAKRERPDARILVTGCAAEIEPETFTAMAEVSGVVPNTAKFEPSRYFPSSQRRLGSMSGVAEGGAMRGNDLGPQPALGRQGGGHARTFLPVQNGCDHRCTFCIIPFGRGPSRSLPAGGVIEEAHRAVGQGAREIVLTGVDLTAYGADLPGQPSLGSLVARILRHVPDLPRLRLSSLDPCEVDAALLELIAHEPRLMPHVHLSLQAGHDLILKRMKRRHSRAQAVALVARLKEVRPDIVIGADLIAGFPTEDAAMFGETLALIDDCAIAFAHIFPYSPRAGTPAARMPQVARSLIKERAAQLRAAGARRKAAWLKEQVGTVRQVLVELDGVSGHADNFARVKFPPARPNSIVAIRMVDTDGDMLTGIAA
ncbi:tRNA (N(6)-L-threonylcarbamoyladenosine(37)-C(2))-methylthiotransferase MtaB [Sphingomonas crusticola]|uniref:tRNA (N(6)-L-threonylcarbamoyladenosine(37)-C(2))- methylthiotransferase MtaB n=1 Tax=Sphingomonas crusticola TaxID=1697973 RepID=UPI000E2348DB|nr:tRNA (N(6)-L-threonylcarbamoyladenosine(37)-C(2))-methylthiotransferase MtaB [Sphingomonas crusticola]